MDKVHYCERFLELLVDLEVFFLITYAVRQKFLNNNIRQVHVHVVQSERANDIIHFYHHL